jgi:hypothetical protein
MLAVCLLLLSFAGATSSEAKETGLAAHIEQAISALRHRTDADSLAAAGLLSLDKHRDRSLPLLEQAIVAAPTRTELIWLQLELCQKMGSCDVLPIEGRLRDLDPSNAAGWIGALVRANSSNDEGAKDTALAVVAHADRFDTYYTTLTARLGEAVIRVHKMTPLEAVATIIGHQAAEPIPGYEAASVACKGERLQRTGVNEACRGVAQAFEHGDTYLAEMVGTAIAKRVWPEGSAEWKAAVETRRVYDYRSKLILNLDVPDGAQMEKYLGLCAKYRREEDLWVAQIVAAGLNPSPPAN